MPNPVERGQQRSTVPAFRVAISGSSSVETIKLRFEVGSTSSVDATLYAVKRYSAMHPKCEVHQVRVSKVQPKNK